MQRIWLHVRSLRENIINQSVTHVGESSVTYVADRTMSGANEWLINS